jgi:hypothetical protein
MLFRILLIFLAFALIACGKQVEKLPCKYGEYDLGHTSPIFTHKYRTYRIYHEVATGQPANGLQCEYWSDGRPFGETPYKNGKIHGVVAIYDYLVCFNDEPATYGVVESVSYKNGMKDGMSRIYDCGGGFREYPYKNGEQEGIYREYFASGAIKVEGSYENGLPNGMFKTYYENGTLMQEKFYQNGEIDGTSRQYSADGQVIMTVIHKNGKFISAECTNDNKPRFHAIMDSDGAVSCDNGKTFYF